MNGTLRPTRGRPWLASGSRTRTTTDGGTRYRVEYRLGGRESTDPLRAARSGPKRLATIARRLGRGRARRAARPRARDPRAPEPARSPTLARGGRTLAGVPRRRRRGDTRCSTAIALDRVLPLLGDRPVDALDGRRRRRRSSPQLHARREGARDDPQERRRALAMVLDYAGVDAEPGPRPVDVKLPREEPEELEPADRRARRGRLPADPVEAPAAAALPRLVGRARVARSTDARRRLRRAAPPCPAARRDDEDEAGALGRAAPRARRRARGAASARARTATPTARLFAELRRRRAADVDREGVQGRSRSRSGRRTTSGTAGSRCCTCAASPGRGSASTSGSATSR